MIDDTCHGQALGWQATSGRPTSASGLAGPGKPGLAVQDASSGHWGLAIPLGRWGGRTAAWRMRSLDPWTLACLAWPGSASVGGSRCACVCVSATAVAVQTEARAGQGRQLQKPRSTSCPLLFCLPAGLRSGGPRDGSRLWSGKRRHRAHGMTGSLGVARPMSRTRAADKELLVIVRRSEASGQRTDHCACLEETRNAMSRERGQ